MYLSLRLCSSHLRRVLSNAEKLVGYSGSYLTLQNILSDEVASVALNVRKLIGTKHPLLDTAKKLFYNGDNAVQTWGLIVLLVARTANQARDAATANHSNGAILASQRSIAELCEIIYTANLVHCGVLDDSQISGDQAKNLQLGNKMAVLGGDFLFSNATTALAKLGQPKVTNWMAQSIADMSQAQFMPGSPLDIESWKAKVYLCTGSLLAHGCKSAVFLAQLPQTHHMAAFEFGQQTAWLHALSTLDSTAKQLAPAIEASPDQIETFRIEARDKALETLNTFPQSSTQDSLSQLIDAISR